MQRDMDLVRKILLEIETKEGFAAGSLLNIDGYSNQDVSYHLKLLSDTKLIKVEDEVSQGWTSKNVYPQHLTWEGHEFLDATRDNKIWQKVKGEVVEKGGSFTFDLLKSLANQFLREQFGLG